MADTQSTTKFRADISQLKKEMQAASRAVRLASAEFKAATAGMDDWGSSADGLQAKLKQLNTTLDQQKKMLEIISLGEKQKLLRLNMSGALMSMELRIAQENM